MCYYEYNKDKFKSDCIELNDAIGEAMTNVEESYGKERSQAITTEVTPVVLTHLLARHFKCFFYDEPEDILRYINHIKDAFVKECDVSDELDMVNSVDYIDRVQA